MSNIFPPLSPVLVQKVQNRRYLMLYKNAWVDGRSRCLWRKMIGRLDGEKIIFGKRFLAENPAYEGAVAVYRDSEVIFLDAEDRSMLPTTELIDKLHVLDAGASYALKEIAINTHMYRDLRETFPNTYKELLSLAIFFILNPSDSVCHYEEFAQRTLLPSSKALAPQRISELFAGIQDAERIEYMRRRAATSKTLKDHAYWAFDTTSISSYSQTLNKVRYGYNKESDPLPQFNIALLMDEVTGEPVYYKTLDGSLNDVSLLRNLFIELDQIDLEQIHVVMDRGFFSLENLEMMFHQGVNFIIGGKRNINLTREHIDSVRPTLKLCPMQAYNQAHGVYCMTRTMDWQFNNRIRGKLSGPLYIHIYYDKEKEANDIATFTEILLKQKRQYESGKPVSDMKLLQKYFECKDRHCEQKFEEWAKFVQNAGITVLLSNDVKDAGKALTIYRQRNEIERAFNNLKDRCSARRMQCQEKSFEGKAFVQYLALSLLMQLKMSLSNAKVDCNSVPKFIKQLNGIKAFRIDGSKKMYWQEIAKHHREKFDLIGVAIPKRII